MPRFEQADVSRMAEYRNGNAAVDVYLNWYASQTQGHELVGYGNRPEGSWQVRTQQVRNVELGRGGPRPVREMIIESPEGKRRVVWYWYQVGNQIEVSEARAKLIGGLQALMGDRGAGLVALSAVCADDCLEATATLGGIMAGAAGPIRRELQIVARAGSGE